MTEKKPLILITNDDGILADGLRYLRDAAAAFGEVRVVAPERERSAISHAISLHDPIKVRNIRLNGDLDGHGVLGTPADSVKIAIHVLLPRKPDLVISGINDGANLGINVLYSGTVSAAREAAMLGVPAMSVSIARKKDPPFEWAIPHIQAVGRWILSNGLPPGVSLNVNIPALSPQEVKGIRITRQALTRFHEEYEPREDPRGNVYYWLSGEVPLDGDDESIDANAVRRGFVSVTPLCYDLTAHDHTVGLADSLERL